MPFTSELNSASPEFQDLELTCDPLPAPLVVENPTRIQLFSDRAGSGSRLHTEPEQLYLPQSITSRKTPFL
jgi:hypothetical protein